VSAVAELAAQLVLEAGALEATVAEFNAAVQAIEALRTYAWSVTSLQEHAAALIASKEAALQKAAAQTPAEQNA